MTSAKDLFYGRGDRTEHCLSKCLKIKLSGTVKSTLSITFFGFIPKENTQGASWSVKEEKCWGKHPTKMVRFAIFLLKYIRYVFTCAMHKAK